jgi:two-component system, chemotaxis family, sensor histidine kinase and response regulator PixL
MLRLGGGPRRRAVAHPIPRSSPIAVEGPMYTFDSEIRDQAYQFFVQEALEFLQTLETGLLNLRQDHSTPRVHDLMRAAHSIKGGAASVGLTTIQALFHRLEDCLRALYSDGVEFDQSLEQAFLQAYDCVSLPLIEQIDTDQCDEAAALEAAERVFAHLEDRLGDALQGDMALPTSAELGIDIVTAIFGGDVSDGLERLETMLSLADSAAVEAELRAQVEVFAGMGELLNLPGFVAIAHTTLAALQVHPTAGRSIGQVALVDFRAGQAAVMAGDRTQGGSPSSALQQMAAPRIAPSPAARSMADAIDARIGESMADDGTLMVADRGTDQVSHRVADRALSVSTGEPPSSGISATELNAAACSDVEAFFATADADPWMVADFNPDDFNPGDFNPGDFNPGDFNPGDFNPGDFNPGDFNPGDFNPDDFTAASLNPGDFSVNTFNPNDFNPDDFSDASFGVAAVGIPVDLPVGRSADLTAELELTADFWAPHEPDALTLVPELLELPPTAAAIALDDLFDPAHQDPLAADFTHLNAFFDAALIEDEELSATGSLDDLGPIAEHYRVPLQPGLAGADWDQIEAEPTGFLSPHAPIDPTLPAPLLTAQQIRDLGAALADSALTQPNIGLVGDPSDDEDTELELVVSDPIGTPLLSTSAEIWHPDRAESVTAERVALEPGVMTSLPAESVEIESVEIESVAVEPVEIESVEIESVEIESLVAAAVSVESAAVESVAIESAESVAVESVESVAVESVAVESVESVAVESVESVAVESIESVAVESVAVETVGLDWSSADRAAPTHSIRSEILAVIPAELVEETATTAEISAEIAAEIPAEVAAAIPSEIPTAIPSEIPTDIPAELPAAAAPVELPADVVTRPAKRPAAKKTSAQPQALSGNSVRVDLSRLERINNLVGELVTQENSAVLQIQQLQSVIHTSLQRFSQVDQMAKNLSTWNERSHHQRASLALSSAGGHRPDSSSVHISAIATAHPDVNAFDALQMDSYSDLYTMVQEVIEAIAQVDESMRDVTLLTQQSQHTQRRKQQTLKHIRNDLLWARMLPLGDLLQRFPRMIHELASQYHKQVQLKLGGTQTLVDKSILQSLYDPLVHLLRNAFDHGVELPDARIDQGKPAQATIEIRAFHRGNQTYIEVADDGRGIDADRVRAKIVERQLLSAADAEALSTEGLYEYLFSPGFSTASQVSALSGRGVGLDAVQLQIKQLKGAVTVTSTPGQGTTFTLRLPLTLTIANLLVFSIQSHLLALPVDTLLSIVSVPADAIQTLQNGQFYQWQDQLVALYPPGLFLQHYPLLHHHRDAFKAMPLPHSQGQITLLMIEGEDQVMALPIDQILQEQELVIKPFGPAIAAPPYLYGCTILGDGSLVPVVDGQALISRQLPTAQLNRQSDIKSDRQLNSELDSALDSELDSESDRQSERAAQAAVAPQPSRRLPIILVVDDSLTTRQTLAMTLQKAGYQTLLAKDGREALDQLEREPQIQAVFCDVEMPRMNGFEFLTQCRQQYPKTALPVIMLTSRSGDKHRQIAQYMGASGYLTKPYLEHDLLTTLQTHLSGAAIDLTENPPRQLVESI